jgi:hypothetical protein
MRLFKIGKFWKGWVYDHRGRRIQFSPRCADH